MTLEAITQVYRAIALLFHLVRKTVARHAKMDGGDRRLLMLTQSIGRTVSQPVNERSRLTREARRRQKKNLAVVKFIFSYFISGKSINRSIHQAAAVLISGRR